MEGSFPSFHRPWRDCYFLIIATFMGVPSESLCGGERYKKWCLLCNNQIWFPFSDARVIKKRCIETCLSRIEPVRHSVYSLDSKWILLLLSFAAGVIYDALQQICKMEAYRDAGKTDPLLNLKKIAYERGFVISDNQGEGNCMFFAISEQLELIQGVKLSHKKLRKKVVRYLKENPTLVSSVLVEDNL